MASRKKKQEQAQDKRDRAGWPGLVELGQVYGFEWFLTHLRPWRAAVTQGDELLHVTWGGRAIVVRYDAELHRTVLNCRHGMTLWYAYTIFHREAIERMMYHEQMDRNSGQHR